MPNINGSLKDMMQVQGCLGAAIVDVNTGISVAQIGSRTHLTTLTEFYANLVRVKEQTISDMNMEDEIEEIILTSESQYHMIYPFRVRFMKVKNPEHLFFFANLGKKEASLAQARSQIKHILHSFTL